MPKYKCKWRIKHNGRDYPPGGEIELTPEEAGPLAHAVEPVKKKSGKEE